MSKSLIELITCESDDWAVLKVDSKEYYSGHSIPDFVWMKLLKKSGCEVVENYINDAQMEDGYY